MMSYWDVLIFSDDDNIQLDAELYPDEDAIELYMDEVYPNVQYQAEYND